MSAYGFSEDSAKRIARVVKSVEGDTTAPTRIGPMLGGSTMSVVKVTALGSPLNTGQRVDYHASANTMNDINEVMIKEVSGATLTVGARYMGQFSGYTSAGLPVFVVKTSTASGGSAVIDVVTDVVVTPTGLDVTYATFSGADYDNAVIKQFLALSDVIPSSYIGNQNRCVKVNGNATGLEFGAITDVTASTFIALTDTPSVYGTSNTYRTLTVSSTNNSIVFSTNNVTTQGSITGGGNPNAPTWEALNLVNDSTSPGNYYQYGTNATGVKGWYSMPVTPAGLSLGGQIVVSSRKAAVSDVAAHTISSADLAAVASSTQTAIDDLKTQFNLLLARIRSHGLIS